jgi:hypothetical protein
VANCADGLTPGFGVGKAAAAAICLLKTDFGIVDGTRRLRTGSGMLFKTAGRSSFVVTAGHNIYDHVYNRTARAIMLWFGRKGDVVLAQREGRAWNAAAAFSSATTPITSDDFGVVRVSGLGIDRFMPIGLADPGDLSTADRLLAGYPDEDSCRGEFMPYNVRIATSHVGATNCGYVDEPTYVGMSGGPLLARPERTHRSPPTDFISAARRTRREASASRRACDEKS